MSCYISEKINGTAAMSIACPRIPAEINKLI
jgi:hypothetical protein